MSLAGLRAQFRAHPIATALEVGSVLVCLLLFGGTIAALSSGAPTETEPAWLAIVAVGAAFVVFWTVLVPLYERFVY